MRITNNKEPITDSAPLVYTERKDGVLPDYNIRTDRMEKALEAMDRVSEMRRDRRSGKRDDMGRIIKMDKKEGDSGAESVQGK